MSTALSHSAVPLITRLLQRVGRLPQLERQAQHENKHSTPARKQVPRRIDVNAKPVPNIDAAALNDCNSLTNRRSDMK